MAWATTYETPAQPQLSFYYSNATAVYNPFKIQFAPQGIPSGSFDSTGMTSATCRLDNGVAVGLNTYVEADLTITATGGAANIVATATATDVGTALDALVASGATSGKYVINATDGTTELVIARGNWILNQSS